MNNHPGSNPPVCPPARPARGRWLTCYALLGAVLAYALVARWFLPLVLSEPIGTEHAPGYVAPNGEAPLPSENSAAANPLVFDHRIDPNLADWPELMRLPGIGEVTAKRIVEYRQENAPGPGLPAFRSAEDLDRVRGIGPKTIEAIKSLLKFSDGDNEAS